MLPFKDFISEDLVQTGDELYFAFGHNTNIGAFEKLDPPAKLLGRASADGYRYVLEQYSDIRLDKDSTIEGVLWSLPKDRESPVNKYEQYYHKKYLTVNFKGNQYRAFAYKMDSKHYNKKNPSKEYIDVVKKGYEENHIPLKQLDSAVKERMSRD